MEDIFYNHVIEVSDNDAYKYRVVVDDDFTLITYEEWNKEYRAYLPFGITTQIPTQLAMKIADAIKELGGK